MYNRWRERWTELPSLSKLNAVPLRQTLDGTESRPYSLETEEWNSYAGAYIGHSMPSQRVRNALV